VLNQVVDIHVFREIGHNLFNLLFLHLTPFCQRLTANCHFAALSGGIDRWHPIKDCVAIHDIFQNSDGPKKIWSGESHACSSQLFS